MRKARSKSKDLSETGGTTNTAAPAADKSTKHKDKSTSNKKIPSKTTGQGVSAVKDKSPNRTETSKTTGQGVSAVKDKSPNNTESGRSDSGSSRASGKSGRGKSDQKPLLKSKRSADLSTIDKTLSNSNSEGKNISDKAVLPPIGSPIGDDNENVQKTVKENGIQSEEKEVDSKEIMKDKNKAMNLDESEVRRMLDPECRVMDLVSEIMLNHGSHCNNCGATLQNAAKLAAQHNHTPIVGHEEDVSNSLGHNKLFFIITESQTRVTGGVKQV